MRELVADCVILLIVLLVIGGVCMIVGYFDSRAMLEEYKSVRVTVDEARRNPNISPVELAALQQKIVDCNKWRAHIKYYDRFFLVHLVLPKEIRSLEALR